MKHIKFGLPLVALALLASCANDNVVDNPADNNQSEFNGQAYFALDIAMPGNVSGRAENYDDGIASEYAVKNGTVYIFKKAEGDAPIAEDNYIFVTSGNLNTAEWANVADNPNEITSQAKTAVVEFEGLTLNTSNEDIYYALVVLNKPKTGFQEPSASTTFKTWRSTAQGEIGGTLTDGLTMSNAPQYATLTEGQTTDASDTYHTLVYIDKNKIKPTPANLESAATIYVQRVVSKVNLEAASQKDLTNFAVEKPNSDYGDADVVVFSNFDLTGENAKTFPVQNAQEVATWKTESTTQPWVSTNTFKRIYWATDPNYLKASASTDLKAALTASSNTDLSKAFYVLENTMEPTAMEVANTTTAVLKGTYKIHGKDACDFMTFGTNLKAPLDATTLAGNYLKLKSDVAAGDQKLSTLLEVDDSKITKENISTVLAKIGATPTEEQETLTPDQKTELIQATYGVTYDMDVVYYPGGVVYYKIPIRHFEDTEAPKPNPFADASSYTNAAKGRFGLVRNNWYTITINTISGVGDPEFPTPDPDQPEPDDPKDKQYIQCVINILSWAKRGHSYDL